MPAIPAALQELSRTAPLYVQTAISREVRWSPETGHLAKLPKRRPAKKAAAKRPAKSPAKTAAAKRAPEVKR